MAAPYRKDLTDMRAALAPTLEATAAVLPWVARPQPLRYSPALNKRWEEACQAAAQAWQRRDSSDSTALRSALTQLLASALDSADIDSLGLSEALASAVDRYEASEVQSPRLIAAITATLEALIEPGGLEHPKFLQRARHFRDRLNQAVAPSRKPGSRSDVLDALYVEDAREHLAAMHEALTVLPLDIYALHHHCDELIQHSEQIEMWGMYHLARQLEGFVVQLGDASQSTQDAARQEIERHLDTMAAALAVIDTL